MADVITFNCSGCSKPYRVAISYAGRDFACKACGQRQRVPQAEAEVELGSGGQVMRGTTTSGRQVAADPTRVFVRERETSARIAAVAPEDAPVKTGKGLVIAIAAVVVLLVGGLGAAAALGAFSGDTPTGNAAASSNAKAPPPSRESERARILKQSDVPGQSAAELMKLLKEAEDAKLDTIDITTVCRAVVVAIRAEAGAGFSDAELMAFAERMQQLSQPTDAETLYGVVVERGRTATEKSPEFKRAHEKLGHAWVEIGPVIERAKALHASGVVEGMDPLRKELIEMEKRADHGWLNGADKHRFDEINGLLTGAQAEYDRIGREEPFRLKVAEAKSRFAFERVSKIGTWTVVGREPFVIFVQHKGSESEAAALERIDEALACTQQFAAYYPDALIKPLGLTRNLPSALPQAERDAAPFEVLLFRDASHWRPYLDDHMSTAQDASMIRSMCEPGTGRASMAFDESQKTPPMSLFVPMLFDQILFSYHPNAPTTQAQDEKFRSYQCEFLRILFNSTISQWTTQGGEFTFFTDDGRYAETLKVRKMPFAKSTRGQINSFGGQVLMLRDFLEFKSLDTLRETTYERLKALPEWTEGDLLAANNASALDTIIAQYGRGAIYFLYYWSEGKYREKFLKFVKMDLAGEVNKDDPVPAFDKAFGLDAAGWKQLEEDFTAYQS